MGVVRPVAPLFIVDDLEPGWLESSEVRVDGPEAHHAVNVRRVRVGERVTIGDGLGNAAIGPIVSIAKASFEVAVESTIARAPGIGIRVALVQALGKGGRDELAVQSATELGVDRVIPWAAERSVVRWSPEKRARGLERWQSIVREASKQSLRLERPTVDPLVDTKALCELVREVCTVLVLDPRASTSIREVAISSEAATMDGSTLALVVGPEGGITPNEIEQMTSVGAVAVSLGSNVLRTSTAGPAALAALNTLLGKW